MSLGLTTNTAADAMRSASAMICSASCDGRLGVAVLIETRHDAMQAVELLLVFV